MKREPDMGKGAAVVEWEVELAGEAEREPGGVRVERKRYWDAAIEVAGGERRSRMGREEGGEEGAAARGCESDGRDWRVLGSLIAGAAMEETARSGWACVRRASSGGCMDGVCCVWSRWKWLLRGVGDGRGFIGVLEIVPVGVARV